MTSLRDWPLDDALVGVDLDGHLTVDISDIYLRVDNTPYPDGGEPALQLGFGGAFLINDSVGGTVFEVRGNSSWHWVIPDGQSLRIDTVNGGELLKILDGIPGEIGFFGATAVPQPTGDILTALSNLGLVAAPTLPDLSATYLPLTMTGARTVKLSNAGSILITNNDDTERARFGDYNGTNKTEIWGILQVNASISYSAGLDVVPLSGGGSAGFSVRDGGSGHTAMLFGVSAADYISFFGGAGGGQQTAASYAALITALKTYGLLTNGSAAGLVAGDIPDISATYMKVAATTTLAWANIAGNAITIHKNSGDLDTNIAGGSIQVLDNVNSFELDISAQEIHILTTSGGAVDVALRRNGNSILNTDRGGGGARIQGSSASVNPLLIFTDENGLNSSFRINKDGQIIWSSAGGAADVNLYRSAANVLKTDFGFHVAGAFRHLGSTLGFFNTAAAAKPTVVGSRGSNAALASLLTALAGLGLLTDSSS